MTWETRRSDLCPAITSWYSILDQSSLCGERSILLFSNTTDFSEGPRLVAAWGSGVWGALKTFSAGRLLVTPPTPGMIGMAKSEAL